MNSYWNAVCSRFDFKDDFASDSWEETAVKSATTTKYAQRKGSNSGLGESFSWPEFDDVGTTEQVSSSSSKRRTGFSQQDEFSDNSRGFDRRGDSGGRGGFSRSQRSGGFGGGREFDRSQRGDGFGGGREFDRSQRGDGFDGEFGSSQRGGGFGGGFSRRNDVFDDFGGSRRDNMGSLGADLHRPDYSSVAPFQKDFYQEHPNVTNRSEVSNANLH